jgi:pimeloyl-ACP methyl ester carboxylesterase
MLNANMTPLLTLSGTLADERVFAPVLERLGCTGISIRMAGATSTAAMAELILAQAPPRFALMGFSLGAIVALEVLSQAPERVERVALFGCNARAMPPEKAAARRATVPVAEIHGTASYIDGVWDVSVPTHRRSDADLRRLLHAMATDTPLPFFREQIEMAIQRVDRRPQLAGLDLPALVACGEEDQVCPAELSAEIADAIPDATFAIVGRAGHYLTLDQPDEVAGLVGDWLARPTRPTQVSKEFS